MERELWYVLGPCLFFIVGTIIMLWRDGKELKKMMRGFEAEKALTDYFFNFSKEKPEIKEIDFIRPIHQKKEWLEDVFSRDITVSSLSGLIVEISKMKNKKNNKIMSDILCSIINKNIHTFSSVIYATLEERAFFKRSLHGKMADLEIIINFSLGLIKNHPRKKEIIALIKKSEAIKDSELDEELADFVRRTEEN